MSALLGEFFDTYGLHKFRYDGKQNSSHFYYDADLYRLPEKPVRCTRSGPSLSPVLRSLRPLPRVLARKIRPCPRSLKHAVNVCLAERASPSRPQRNFPVAASSEMLHKKSGSLAWDREPPKPAFHEARLACSIMGRIHPTSSQVRVERPILSRFSGPFLPIHHWADRVGPRPTLPLMHTRGLIGLTVARG